MRKHLCANRGEGAIRTRPTGQGELDVDVAGEEMSIDGWLEHADLRVGTKQ